MPDWRAISGLLRAAACASLLLLLTGCGQSGPDLGQVTGRVTRKGKPVTCTVVFQPTDGRPSLGFADGEGKFTLQYLRDTPGARVGTHTVFVTFDGAGGPEMELARAAGKTQERKEERAILAKYGPDSSKLTIEVKPGEQTIDLPLD